MTNLHMSIIASELLKLNRLALAIEGGLVVMSNGKDVSAQSLLFLRHTTGALDGILLKFRQTLH